jgi:hypothetical protein
MRLILASLLVAALAACGSSHASSGSDAPSGTDGNGSNNPDGPGGGPATVTVTIPNLPANPATFSLLVAYQDGGGAWTVAPAPTNSTFTLTIHAAAWSFAWACIPVAGTSRVQLASFSVSEKTSLTEYLPVGCSDAAGMAVQLSGTVTGLPQNGGGGAFVAAWGNREALVNAQGTDGTFQMNVLPGTHDLLIAHVTATGGFGGDAIVDAAAIARNVTVNGATMANAVDFGTANGSTVPVTVASGSATARITVVTRFFSAGGTIAELVRDTAAPFESNGLAASPGASGDIYNQQISVTDNGATATVQNWTATLAAQTYNAPAGLGGATGTVTTSTPYPEISSMWSAYTGAVGYSWDAQQGGGVGGGAALEWTADLSPGYLGGSPHYQMPDLSMLTGWNAGWQFQAGTPVLGSVTAQTSSGGIGDFPPPSPAAIGTHRAFVDSRWTVTP